jgi:glutathione peroxidase
LNALQRQYKDELVVLAFPCNQFAWQEPGANASEIYNSLKYVRPGGGFEPAFPLFKKIDVNGPNATQVYKYMKESCPSPKESFASKLRLTHDVFESNDIRWNFEKILVDQSGLPYMRFEPAFLPANIAPHIDELVSRQKKLGTSNSVSRPGRSTLRLL